MKKIILGLLAIPTLASARVGETRAQLFARYGEPLPQPQKVTRPAGEALLFQKAGFSIVVQFLGGFSVSELYSKTDGSAIAPTEVETVLHANAAEPWTKSEGPAGAASWTSQDGTVVAVYRANERMLNVTSTDFTKRAADAKAADERAKLKGF